MTAPSPALRLLIVTPRSPLLIGGVERHVREVSTRLAAAGVHVQVLCGEPGASEVQETTVDGVLVRSVPAYPKNSDWLLAPRLWREMSAARADIVHVQSYHTLIAPLAMSRARSLGLPYVLTFHGGGSSVGLRNSMRGTQRRAQRRLYAHASRLIAVAQFEVERYAQELHLDPAQFTLIPNGTDLALSGAGAALPDPPVDHGAETLVASIGRLERYKGHHKAIAALPALVRRRPRTRLVIVGEGPYEGELRALAAASGVGDRIDFTSVPPGDAGGMAQLLARVDLVLLLSEFETHPLVALEAAAMRRRMVVADAGGLGELAAKGFGRAVSLDLSADLVAEVADQELAKTAPERSPELFSWDDCAEALMNLYSETLPR